MQDWKSRLISVSLGVNELRCQSWAEFMAFVDCRHRNTRGMLFRGQREESWLIESTLLRELKKKLRRSHPDWDDNTIAMLAARHFDDDGGMIMQSYASHLSRREQVAITDAQTWMLGRHNGLLSPFVDWTRSPYIAAFFAAADVVECGRSQSGGCFVVDFISQWLFPYQLSKRMGDNGKLKRHALQIDAAYLGNPRGIAQRAVATYTYPQVDIATFATESVRGHGEAPLTRVLLPHPAAADALNHLHHMNVNYFTLFPDSFGLARQANLNFYLDGYEGMGNWLRPPGFATLIPNENLEGATEE